MFATFAGGSLRFMWLTLLPAEKTDWEAIKKRKSSADKELSKILNWGLIKKKDVDETIHSS